MEMDPMNTSIVDISRQPELVLGAYRPPFTRLMRDEADALEAYRRYADAGLNLMVEDAAAYDDVKTDWVTRACEACGVRMILNLPEAFYTDEPERGRGIVDKLLKSPAFMAFIMTDEPSAGAFPALARARQAGEAMLPPDRFVMGNLFPNWVDARRLGMDERLEDVSLDPEDPFEHYLSSRAYIGYVGQFLDAVGPRVLCYDHYPISDRFRTDRGWEAVLSYAYFRNMAVARMESARRGIPFWSIVQAWGYNGDKPAPNAYETRWLVNANYLFGGQATIYFVYQNSYPEGTGPERWVDAPVDYDGHATAQYPVLRQVNREFNAYGKAFMQYEPVGILLHRPQAWQHHAIPAGMRKDSFAPLSAVEGEDSLFIGCRSDGTRPALFVMNGSVRQPACGALLLDGERHYEVWGKGGREANRCGQRIPLRLEPGESKFIAFDAL